jgi:hypothetical protein
MWSKPHERLWPLVTRPEFPWANALELRLRARPGAAPLTVWLTQGVSGPVAAWRLLEARGLRAQNEFSRIDLGDITQIEQDTPLVLHMGSAEGWEVAGGEDGPDFRLLCDLKRERHRSKCLIEHPNWQ